MFVCLSLPLYSELLERFYVFSCFSSCQQHPGWENISFPTTCFQPERSRNVCLPSQKRKIQGDLLMSVPALPHSCPGCSLYQEMQGKKSHVLDSAPSTSPFGLTCPQNIHILCHGHGVSIWGRLESEGMVLFFQAWVSKLA